MKIHGKSSLFQKVHLRLTLLFTGIAGLILVILSVSYLLMSEKEWRDYSYLAFLRESETIVSNLAQQKTINQRWLSDITENNHYFLAVYDNGTPLTSTDTVLDDAHKELADRFLAIATTDFSAMSTDANHTTLHTDFSYRTKADITYDIYAARLGTRKTPLCAVIFSPTTELEERLSNERLRFLLIDIFGILFLFLFSYFYTKKLLSPIQENQKQQTEFLSALPMNFALRLSLCSLTVSMALCGCGHAEAVYRYV